MRLTEKLEFDALSDIIYFVKIIFTSLTCLFNRSCGINFNKVMTDETNRDEQERKIERKTQRGRKKKETERVDRRKPG